MTNIEIIGAKRTSKRIAFSCLTFFKITSFRVYQVINQIFDSNILTIISLQIFVLSVLLFLKIY